MAENMTRHGSVSIHKIAVGWLQANCFILYNSEGQALVIDPGGEAERIQAFLEEKQGSPLAILLTHAHFDHLHAVGELAECYPQAPIILHPDDRDLYDAPDEMMQAFMPFLPAIGALPAPSSKLPELPADLTFQMLHTPGHSPGSCGYYFPQHKAVFVGDTLFRDSIGRHDFPGGSLKILLHSIQSQLFTLPGEVHVFCGHGPDTSIARERRENPFFHGNQDASCLHTP